VVNWSAEDTVTKALSLLRRAISRRGRTELEPASEKTRLPWLRFSYSYRSLTADDEQAHVVVRERRFEDGRLEAEDFEGTVETRRLPELMAAAGDELRRLLRALLDR